MEKDHTFSTVNATLALIRTALAALSQPALLVLTDIMLEMDKLALLAQTNVKHAMPLAAVYARTILS